MTTQQKFTLIAALYIAEGLPFGFFTQGLQALLRESGLSLREIGLTSLLALPWALKFLWAPLVDRYYWPRLGRRRSWLLPTQALTVIVLIWAAMLDFEQQLFWVFVAVLLCNFLAATLDIATDGLAVQILKPSDRGIGNGIQVGGYRLGMMISGGALLIVFEQIGWRGSFLLMATLVAIMTIPAWRFQEPPESNRPASSKFNWSFVTVPGVGLWLLAIFVYKFGDSIGAGMVKPFLIDAGLSLAQIGWVAGTWGAAASLLGAAIGGYLTSRIGGYRCVIGFGLLQVVGIASYAFVAAAPDNQFLLYSVMVLESLVGGMVTAAVFTLMMSACRPQSEGTDYTIQACVFVIAAGVAAALAGYLAESLGYVNYFSASAVMALIGLLPIIVAANKGGFRALSH